MSGITFTFDASKKAGERVVDGSVRVAGKPIDPAGQYKLCTKDYLRQGKDGFDVFPEAVCLADGEQTGILPTIVREVFLEIEALNGMSEDAPLHTTHGASRTLSEMGTCLTRVGEGPDLMKRYAMNPQVEGRIVCLNPDPAVADS